MGWRRRLGVALGSVLTLYAGAVVASRGTLVRERVERLASAGTGYDVRLERLGLTWGLDARAEGAAISVPGRDPFLSVERLEIVGVPQVLLGLAPAVVRVLRPRFRLARWEPPPRAEAGTPRDALPGWIAGVEVWGGFVEGGVEAQGRPVALGPIDLTVTALAAGAALHLAGSSPLLNEQGRIEWSARLAPGGESLTAQARAELPRLGGVAEALGAELPVLLRESALAIEAELEGGFGASLPFVARGRLVPGPEAPALGLEASGSIDLETGRMTLAASARNEEPERPLLPEAGALRLAELSLEGETALDGASAQGRVAFVGLGFRDPSGSTIAEGLRLSGKVSVQRGEAGHEALQVELRADSGEVLAAGRYYLDLTAVPIDLTGTLHASEGALFLGEGRLAARGLGSASLGGNLTLRPAPSTADPAEPPAPRPRGTPAVPFGSAEIVLDLPEVAPVFALALRDPWQEAFPILSGMEVAGPLRARLTLRRAPDGGLSLAGRLRWERGRLSVASPEIAISRLDLDLPLLLGAARSTAGTDGSLELAGLSIGGVEIGPVVLPLRAARDRLALIGPASIRALDGTVVLNELAVSAPDGASPALNLDLRAEGLRLATLAIAVGLPAFGGVLTAELPRARLAAGELEVEGTIVLEVFDGTVRLERLRARDLGSGIATFTLDASFDGISLGALTDVVEIGKISGVVRGAVEDLEVQAGTPVRFRAWLETVPRSGVAQRISVDAIRRLSILGGSGGDPLSSGVLSFFDEYRYAKLGFRGSLTGDRLTLEGIERHEGKEYLVVGALLPPRVDVVSHSSSIAFSEMVRRLGRALESEGPRVE